MIHHFSMSACALQQLPRETDEMSSTTEHGSRAPWDLPQPASTAAVHGTVTGSAQEVDSACRQLDFHRIGLSQAIREIDSLDAVMDCLSTKSCAFEDADCQTEGVVLSPSLSRLLAMAEQEIGKPTRRPDKGSGVQMQDAEVMTSQRHVLDLQQQLEGARQREQDRAMSLAAVLRRANEEVQGLKEGSELLAVTLCQRNEEVASLQTGLAECEREIRNISALLLEALRNAVVGLPQKADTAASMPEPAKLALVKIPSHPKQEETIKYSPGGRRNHSGGSGHSLDVIGWLADGSDTETVLRHSGDDSDRAGAASEALAQQRPADLPPETHASVLPPVVGIFSWQQRRAFPKHEGRQATPWRAPGHSSSSPDSARNYKPPPGMTYIEMITEIAAAFKDDAPHAQPGEEVPHDIPSHGAVPLGSEDDGHPQSVPCEGETRGPGVAAESCGKELSDAGENELAASPLPKSIEEFVKEMYEVPQSEGSSSGQAKQQGSSPDGQPMQGEQGQRKPRQHKLKFWVPPMQLLRIPRPGCSYTEQFAIRSQAEARISAYLAQRGQSQRKPNPDQPITARLFRTRKQTPFSSSKIRMRHAHNSLASTSQHRQQSAGVLFAGDAWHKAVHVASKSRHPCPGGEAAPLVASWDCSALPPVPAASRNPARLQRSLSMLGVSKEALPTPDALGMQRASVPRVRRSPSKEQPRISDNETGAGVDLAARLLRQQRAIETMADKSSSGGSLDIEAPQQSKAENRPSPDEERNAGDVHPVFEVQVYCSLDPKVSAQGYESRPLAWEFSRWKHACGWASTGFVVLREMRQARRQVAAISKSEFAALRFYSRPAAAVKFTLEALAMIFRHSTGPLSWAQVLSLVKAEGSKEQILRFRAASLPPEAINCLQAHILSQPEFTVMDVARANRALSPLLRWVKAVVTYGAYRYSHESAYRPIHNKLGLHKAAQWQRPAKDLKVGRKDQGTAFSLLEAQMDRWRSIVTADNWASKDPVEARRKDNLPNP